MLPPEEPEDIGQDAQDSKRAWFSHPQTVGTAKFWDAEARKHLLELIAGAKQSSDPNVRAIVARYDMALACAISMRPQKHRKEA